MAGKAFLNVTIRYVFSGKFATFGDFERIRQASFVEPVFFLSKNPKFNISRNLIVSIAFYSKFAIISNFSKIQGFVLKKLSYFYKKISFFIIF